MGGRIYDPLAGRFITPDPVMQAPYWSQGQNRYSYVFNDPINSTDPSGFATEQNTASNALAVGTDPAVLGWGATAVGAAVAHAGALSVGLGALAGAGNMVATAAMNPFGGSTGGSYQVPSGSAAATSNGGGANAPIATAENRPPGPNPSMAAGPKNAGPDPMLCQSGMFDCDWEGGTMKWKSGKALIPAPDGTTLLQMSEGLAALWRWLRPPPAPFGGLSRAAEFGIRPYGQLTRAIKGHRGCRRIT